MHKKITFQQMLWSTLLIGFLGTANAVNFTVDQFFDGVDVNPGDGACATIDGDCTLRAAVMETNALTGIDSIDIPPGTYNLVLGNTGEDLATEGDLDILDDLTITGTDPATTILTGNSNQFRVLSVLKRADMTIPIVSISNVSLAQGIAGVTGAVLYNEGNLTLSNVTVDNASVNTAPVYNWEGSFSIDNSRIINNVAGIHSQRGSLSINNSTFDNNISTIITTIVGSAIYISATTTNINNSSFSSNATNGGGAAIYNDRSQLTIDNSQFNGNTATGFGGAIYSSSDSSLKVSNSSFDGNKTSRSGGALNFANGTIIDTSITKNTAATYGGGIYSASTYDSVILKRVTLTGNQAITQDGGGAYLGPNFGSIDISDSVITGNSAANNGGGLVLSRGNANNPTSVRHTEISGNVAAYGGGVSTQDGNIQLKNLTLSGNSASVDGGGLYHNAAYYAIGAVQLTHVTLVANTAPASMGGNIANAAGIVQLSNTLIANAGSGLNCIGSITSLGYNLDSSNTCGLDVTGDKASTNPLIGALANNGGTTKTHALLTDSPAIDADNTVLCAINNSLDQRYFYRDDGACDIGAYEVGSVRAQSGTLSFSVINLNVNEMDGMATVTASRIGGSEGDVSIWYEDMLTGSARNFGNDYTTVTRAELQWLDGDVADKTFDIIIRDNSSTDGNKTINLALNNFTDGGAAVGSLITTRVTIVDDEFRPGEVTLDAATYAVVENGSSIDITVNRLNGNAPVSIDYATSDDTAIAGTDYTASNGTLNFGTDQTNKTFQVYVSDNSIYESDKIFGITLSNPQGGVALGQWPYSVVTIQEDEAPPNSSTIAFKVTLIDVNEEGGSVSVSVTRTGNTASIMTVDYVTVDGTAVAGNDYTAVTGTVTFNTGITNKNITLYITDDAVKEGQESFTVLLSNPSGGARLGLIQVMTANIQDDDTDVGGKSTSVGGTMNPLLLLSLLLASVIIRKKHWRLSEVEDILKQNI